MENHQSALAAAIAADIIRLPFRQDSDGTEWLNMNRRIQLFDSGAKGRVTLFLGAAVSSFKPSHLPMWNQFVELIWLSILQVGLDDQPSHQDLFEEFKSFFDTVKADVPNYLITEIISRRLGLQYLDLLEAFQAQNLSETPDKLWAINSVHRWAARSLMANDVAAIVTTNFDNYLEKALEAASAISYQVTGDAHRDGPEIAARLPLVSETSKLVLIVNGPKAFAFVRSLMPQLGGGKITFLFKLHGSCYDPPSCIDTRLQRSQGLPSYSTDILDTLLVRSVWLVAGFSGSDMNDNLDYLRLVSNRDHARVIWLEHPTSYREKALNGLMKVLDLDPDRPTGLCLISGYFVGERKSVEDETPEFASKVLTWAGSLGRDWCKLVAIDLMILFKNWASEQPRPVLLQALNHGVTPRQDWNLLLSGMSLTEQQDQIDPASACYRAKELLERIMRVNQFSSEENPTDSSTLANKCLKDLGSQHVALEKAALMSPTPRPHAQTWVLSSLSGLIMLCGGQIDAAMKSFEISAGLAWVVGDFEGYQLVRNTIATAEAGMQGTHIAEPEIVIDVPSTRPCVAFAPAMDNVSSKSNRFGVPPAVYIRALLHRSVLFADGLAIPANVITGSTIFIDEVLFQGELDDLDEFLAQHLYPLLPEWLDDSGITDKFARYVASRHQSYIQEPVQKKHIQQLDEYFGGNKNSERILYYDEVSGSKKYGSLFKRQLDSDHTAATVEHLVQLWQHITPSGHWDVQHDDDNSRSLAAKEAALDVVQTLQDLGATLPEQIYRSSLYKFADLFDDASDPDSFVRALKPTVSEQDKAKLMLGRSRIVERPWMYGPYCHELFDMPYRCNMSFNQAARSDLHTLVFLEDFEVPSWEFMSEVNEGTTTKVRLVVTPPSTSGEHKCSSLLLSQAAKKGLMQARNSLHHVRAKFAADLSLSEEDTSVIKQVMGNFETRSLKLPDVQVERFVKIQPAVLLESAQDLLQRCVFLVRKGLPLDPMYDEAQLTVPGLHALRHE